MCKPSVSTPDPDTKSACQLHNQRHIENFLVYGNNVDSPSIIFSHTTTIMKTFAWLTLLLISCVYAKDSACSNAVYGALAPLAQVQGAKGFCDAKFPPPGKRSISTTASRSTSTTRTPTSTPPKISPSRSRTTLKVNAATNIDTTTRTSLKMTYTSTSGDKLSAWSLLALNMAKTFCSCYFSTQSSSSSSISTTTTANTGKKPRQFSCRS